MKRFFSTFLCVVLTAISLAGCADSIEYPSYLNIRISQKIEDQEERDEISEKVEKDLKPLHKLGVPLKEYDLVVEYNPVVDEKMPPVTQLNCSPEQILNGDYLRPLVFHYMDLTIKDQWKKYAIYAYLYEEPLDTESVLPFLSDEENKDVLSMFPAYFSTYYKTDEEIEVNANIARLYGRFIIKKYGVDELVNCLAKDHINEWLESIGIPYTFTDEYAEVLDKPIYNEDRNSAFMVETNYNIRIYCVPSPTEGDDVFLLRKFIYDAYVNVEKIMNTIKEDTPEYYETAYKNLTSDNIKVIFREDNKSCYDQGTIYLGSYVALPHEVCHSIIPANRRGAQRWSEEGFGNYMSFIICGVPYGDKEEKKEFIDEVLEKGRDYYIEKTIYNIPIIYDLIAEYTEKCGVPESAEDVDLFEYLKCETRILTEYQMQGYNVIDSVADSYGYMGGRLAMEEENSEISYNQAAFFDEYLIENYSLTNFLAFAYDDKTFEEAFGAPFDEELNKWRNEFVNE